MTEINPQSPILVTGASGYIASWIVKDLLEKGHTVHASVRDPQNQKKVGPLVQLAENSPGELKLFAADLLQDGSFDEAVKGCELVIHTASPFLIRVKDAQRELIDPALQGTRNVLQSCNRETSVKRVVLTSSVASIYGDAADMSEQGLTQFTEQQWNNTSSLKHQPYSYSKKLAEEEAWKIVKAQSQWDLVCINPGLVLGPSLTKASDSTSLSTIKQLVDGSMKPGAPALHFGMVDVRDVAAAHIQAGFTPAANGRYITVAETVSMLEMAQMIRRDFGPAYPTPQRTLPKWVLWLAGPTQGITRKFVSRNVGYTLKFDNHRIQDELGMSFRRPGSTLRDHFQQMLDDGIIKRRG